MKSITIHKIDDMLEKRLADLASEEGVSLNKLIKRLLRERLGLDSNPIDHHDDFVEFCGKWSEEEHKEFVNATSECSKVAEGVRG